MVFDGVWCYGMWRAKRGRAGSRMSGHVRSRFVYGLKIRRVVIGRLRGMGSRFGLGQDCEFCLFGEELVWSCAAVGCGMGGCVMVECTTDERMTVEHGDY